ncbi:MAG TPA: protein kinase [Myxococcaceae bacterium]|jgi:serine/threonine-protein kinase
MTTEAFHPDHLKQGDMVGSWRIAESLGSGNFGHVFKVERGGDFFTLKMAVRPAAELPQETPEKSLEARQADGRMRHEGAILMANTSHPGLPHLRGIDRWPHPTKGYLYIVTDFVQGEPFHTWRERTRPNAAQLVDIFIEVVRAVVPLHRHGILIRDFKSEHVLITPEDHKPVLVDFGSAYLPGGSTLTVGLAPGTPHALPPECIDFLREGSWKQGARFEASPAGDLYQLGVFMYEALTECWPFDARLPRDELLVAIETAIPRAPHRMNPQVPESLSHITLRLLEKRPQDRYASAEALLQALWEAAKERAKKPWKVPLRLPAEGPAPMSQDEVEERRLQKQEAERRAQEPPEEQLSREQILEQQLSFLTQEIDAQVLAAEEKAARRQQRWRRMAVALGPLVLGLVLLFAWWVWREPTTASPAEFEKGNPLVSTLRNSRPMRAVTAWMCTTLTLGCAASQTRPVGGDCPEEARKGMVELGLLRRGERQRTYGVIIDINQPGTDQEEGIFPAGKITSRLVDAPLPEGSLLYGQLWSEGITKNGKPAVYGRYTEVLLPDGRRRPVCIVLGDHTGLSITSMLTKEWSAVAVEILP